MLGSTFWKFRLAISSIRGPHPVAAPGCIDGERAAGPVDDYLQVWIGVIHRVRLVFIKLEWTGNAGGLNW